MTKSAGLVTFTEEILNGKLHFFVQCNINRWIAKFWIGFLEQEENYAIATNISLKYLFFHNTIYKIKDA